MEMVVLASKLLAEGKQPTIILYYTFQDCIYLFYFFLTSSFIYLFLSGQCRNILRHSQTTDDSVEPLLCLKERSTK